jgi:hypothetical protein
LAAVQGTVLTAHQAQDASRTTGHRLCDAMVKGHMWKLKRGCSAESDGGSDKENPEMSVLAGKSDRAGTGSTCQRSMRRKHDDGFEKIFLILERQDCP